MLASVNMGMFNNGMFVARGCYVLVGVASLAAGCASAPIQTMSDTRQTIRAAEAAGASQAAPEALAAARDELHRAEQMIRVGEYRAARREAEAARQRAADALSAAQQQPR
ncbi:MAG: DUF4398 domain-containing protein [Proteobacteria bacterium]|nr:DUF4398 domain-containing protein [Pseudomonadota bacterium]